jgi:membrane protein implicated in regulation of membrane protease activity
VLLALLAPNPASHLVWWVAAVLFGLLAVFALVELRDWLHDRLRRRSAAEDELTGDREDGERWVLREPDTELRRRTRHRVEPHRRTWHEDRPNAPRDRR